ETNQRDERKKYSRYLDSPSSCQQTVNHPEPGERQYRTLENRFRPWLDRTVRYRRQADQNYQTGKDHAVQKRASSTFAAYCSVSRSCWIGSPWQRRSLGLNWDLAGRTSRRAPSCVAAVRRGCAPLPGPAPVEKSW